MVKESTTSVPVPDLRIALLADHPEVVPALCALFEAEWPAWYGPDGPASARADLEAYAQPASIPLGIVALAGSALAGFMALKHDAIAGHEHLGPWVGAGVVIPELRGQGIGSRLLAALEQQACRLAIGRLYAGTARADGLLRRAGWQLLGETEQQGERVRIFLRQLPPVDHVTG